MISSKLGMGHPLTGETSRGVFHAPRKLKKLVHRQGLKIEKLMLGSTETKICGLGITKRSHLPDQAVVYDVIRRDSKYTEDEYLITNLTAPASLISFSGVLF